jgi:hypothetical protein
MNYFDFITIGGAKIIAASYILHISQHEQIIKS